MGRPKKSSLPGMEEPEATDLETRYRIIKAAEELFMARGYKGVSMKDVAEVVEVTPAALYYHFPDGKQDLFLDIIKTMFDDWAGGVAQAIAPGRDFRERLKLLTLYFLSRNRNQFPMLMRDVNQHIADEEKKRSIWQHYGQSYVQAVASVFQAAIDRGEITPHVPAYTLALMYQGMHIPLLHDPRMAACRNDAVETERLAQTLVSALVDGIGQRQPAASL